MASFTKPGLSHHTTLGGTGISIDRTDQGSLLIGDGTGFKLNTLIGGTGISIVNGDGTITISGTPAYTLPIASASVLGGIKVGANLSIDGGGVLSGAAPYTLPIASPTILGGIKVGTNLTIDIAGVLSATAAPYTLPVASVSVLGGVKQGSNVTIDGSGVISVAAPYTLPIASAIVLGGIKVGSGLSIDGGGVLSAAGGGGGGMSFEGTWSGNTSYTTNNVVFYQGTSYIATAPINVSSNTESAYQTLVLADSPVAFWPLTESGTTVGATYADVTGHGYDVAVNTGNVTHTTGIFPLTTATTAPLFNSNDALWTNNTLGLPVNGSAYSLEGWVLPQNNFTWMSWMVYGPTNFSGKSIGSDMNCGRTTILETNNPTNFHSSVLSFNLNTGSWRHVVWTDDGAGNVKLYVDSILIQSFSGGVNNGVVYNVSNVLYLGDPGLQGGVFPAPLQEAYKGGLSHMAIYNVALTPTQITNHYNASALLNPSPDNATLVWTALEDDANYSKVPAVKVYSSQNQSFSIGFSTDVVFDSSEFDVMTPNGQWDGGTGLYAYESGYYEIYAAVLWKVSGTTGTNSTRFLTIARNPSGTTLIQRSIVIITNTSTPQALQEIRVTMFLSAGQSIKLVALSNQTNSPQILALKSDTNAISPVFQMVKLD